MLFREMKLLGLDKNEEETEDKEDVGWKTDDEYLMKDEEELKAVLKLKAIFVVISDNCFQIPFLI